MWTFELEHLHDWSLSHDKLGRQIKRSTENGEIDKQKDMGENLTNNDNKNNNNRKNNK